MNKQLKAAQSTSNRQTFIGFAPPLLGAEPVRLPVLGHGQGLLALNLPGGIAADADPLNASGTPLVVQGLREQVATGKPELMRLGIGAAQSIFNLEPEMSGIALFGVNKQGVEFWRNAYGSELLRLRFLLFCERAPDLPDSLECTLPIARHREEAQMLVSHKSGKKTFTTFRRLAVTQQPTGRHNPLFDKELWEASCTYLRPHQVRLHAHEIGLRICGESLYAKVPSFYLSELKGLRRPLAGERVLWAAPMVHLGGIEPVDAAALTAALAAAEQANAPAASPEVHSLRWPLAAPLPRPLGLASRLLFGSAELPE